MRGDTTQANTIACEEHTSRITASKVIGSRRVKDGMDIVPGNLSVQPYKRGCFRREKLNYSEHRVNV